MSLVIKVTPTVERPNEPKHWPGKLYPEWELEQLGESDDHYNRWDLDQEENHES